MWIKLFLLSCSVHINIICGWQITQLNTPQIGFSHSPYWDDDTQSLYFVNFMSFCNQSSIFRFSVLDGIFYSAYIDGVTSPSFIIPTNKCKKCNKQLFAVGVGADVKTIMWNGKSKKAKVTKTIFSIDDTSMRYDIGVVDSRGHFYAGSLSNMFCKSSAFRSFYRYTKEKGVNRLFGNIQSTTGIVFNQNLNKMYHLDTCQLFITEFDWDPETGDICNGRVVFKFPLNGKPMNTYFPIGLAIDLYGMLFMAVYSGEVWKINPWTGDVIDIIVLPVPGATGITFGGAKQNVLYVIVMQSILDVLSANFVGKTTNGTSIYAITGLDGLNSSSTCFDIK